MRIHAKNLTIYCSCKVIVIVFAAALLPGCTALMWGYGPDGQSLEDFEHRVEEAFRLQNTMTSEVMEIQSDGSNPKEHEPIFQAEQIMEKNCRHLNEYVSRDIDGQNKSILLLRRVENSVSNCESYARKVKDLLKKYQR